MERLSRIVRTVAVAVALVALAFIGRLFARRFVYPYDLEWMEGGMLAHSLRLLEGQPIYAAPSLDFIPFLYTPLYPALLALLSKPLGLGYQLGRAVSILSFAAALAIGGAFARRVGGSRAAALIAMALPAMAFARTGTFYDIARPDSLWLLLTATGLFALYRAARNERDEPRRDPRRHLTAAAAAILLVAAFFTKQTASPLMIAGGIALLALDRRLVPTVVLSGAGLGLPLLYFLNRASGGWFWKYVFELHQQHDFYAARAFRDTPIELLKILGPALIIVPWALLRRRSVGLLYASWLLASGMVVACVAFGTQWAVQNAFIPGVYFPAVAIGAAAGRLVDAAAPRAPRLRPAIVHGLLIASLALLRFDPRPLVPGEADRLAGDRLIQRLREAKGEVLIPFHPFYAHLAGKRTYLHRMGVLDIARAGLGAPSGLEEALRGHRFQLAIFDDKIIGNWYMWPGLLESYEESEPSIGPGCVTGAQTHPRFAYVPKLAPPPPPPGPGPEMDLELQ